MNYLTSFKHKWIYYALSVLIASIAAHESARLLFLLIFLGIFIHFKRQFPHIVGVMIFGILSYFYFTYEIQHLNKPLQLPVTLTWTGEYKVDGDVLRGFMKDEEGRKVYIVYEINSEQEKKVFLESALVGRRYIVYGNLEVPTKPNHSYAFQMDKYLKSKGALGILEISKWQYVGTKESIVQKITIQRFNLKKHIEGTFPESLVAEAQSLIIGLQENVDEEIARAYQKLGITHLFAISGLHIAIVSLIFYQGLLRLRVRREFASIVLLIVLPIYAVLAGGAPSVWRAVVVVEILLISRLKGKVGVDDALAICFILFVFLQPWSIFQIGFQLSYLATASLIYSGQFINRYSSWIVKSFFITFVCQLLVYPLLLYHFYEISISSFIMNIFFVPLFSFIILPINIILLVASYFPSIISTFLFGCYEPIRGLLTDLILFFQSLPNQMWNPGKPSIYLIIISYFSVFVGFYLLERRAKFLNILTVLLIPAIILHFNGKLSSDIKISFINVGQGDCIVIELPYRKAVYMIDTGGLLRFEQESWKESNSVYEVGREIVVPYLKGEGIQKIDKLILTHADADHVEGAEEVLQEINVGEIHISPSSYQKEVMNDLIAEAVKKNIPIKEQMINFSWKESNTTFTYLWPNETIYDGNNDSLVLHVSNGQFRALFMGDVEEEGEQAILNHYPNLSQIDLLKAGHHGSKTSSTKEFIDKLQPTLTIFSAGENNRYGHPHIEVVERFKSLGLQTLTTGEVGTIELIIKDTNVEVRTTNH